MKEIEANRDLGLVLVGFVDDNPRIHVLSLVIRKTLRKLSKNTRSKRVLFPLRRMDWKRKMKLGAFALIWVQKWR